MGPAVLFPVTIFVVVVVVVAEAVTDKTVLMESAAEALMREVLAVFMEVELVMGVACTVTIPRPENQFRAPR
jgi:hypothetical protein